MLGIVQLSKHRVLGVVQLSKHRVLGIVQLSKHRVLGIVQLSKHRVLSVVQLSKHRVLGVVRRLNHQGYLRHEYLFVEDVGKLLASGQRSDEARHLLRAPFGHVGGAVPVGAGQQLRVLVPAQRQVLRGAGQHRRHEDALVDALAQHVLCVH